MASPETVLLRGAGVSRRFERAGAEVDADTERQLIELIVARKRSGRAALIATHSMALGAAADRVYRIADGRIIDDQS